ncbi:MAG: sugar kinase [Gammaproteobacteria bacterium]|nr:sugar kinase [Gammaproteobacteria bacterium]
MKIQNSESNTNIAVIGECMLEMSCAHDNHYRLSFAGDTYNVAVYLKRALRIATASVEYVTALGNDLYSQQMIEMWHSEGIESHLVRHFADKLPGLYTIETDASGERQFYYYRSSAAVRDLFAGDDGSGLAEKLLGFKYLFLSAITLAVLHSESRRVLIEVLREAHKRGCIIVFDSNYRQRLWESEDQARSVIDEVLPFVSLGFPSFNDAQALFSDKTPEQTAQRWRQAGVKQVAVKLGEKGYGLCDDSGYEFVAVTPVKQIDTTAAGDSFDGTLLASLINGDDFKVAAAKAAAIAAKVVAHKGAIIQNT